MQLGAALAFDAADVVTGGEAVGAEIARGGEQIGELDGLIAAHARDRGAAFEVAIDEIVDDGVLKAIFVVQQIVRNAEGIGDAPRIDDVLARATSAAFHGRCAHIVKLQGDAHDVVALAREHPGDDRGIHAARHRHHDAGVGGRLGKAEAVHIWRGSIHGAEI